MKQKQRKRLKQRNYLVPIVIKKTGAGKHRNRKKESKDQPLDKEIYHD